MMAIRCRIDMLRPMKSLKPLLIALLVCLAEFVRAQDNADVKVVLSTPTDYQVFQRQTVSTGAIVVEGTLEVAGHGALSNVDAIEARLVNGATTNPWVALPYDNRVRGFRGNLASPAGGWYRLELRLVGGSGTVFATVVEHVGVGEIFLVAGQSNSANHGDGKQKPKSPLVVAFGNGRWQPAGDPEPGASGRGGSFMPAFGDAMVEKFKVPVALVPLGVGSTSVREWLPKGDEVAAPCDTGRNLVCVASNRWLCTGELFDHITQAEILLGANGFRAVLWHQGESDSHEPPDRQISPEQYRQYLQRIIEASRTAAGWRVPWFVAQASYHNPDDQGSPELRAAQKSLAADGIALAGPNTDSLGPEYRQNNGRGVHFNPAGLQKHAQMWADAVSPWLDQQLAGK
jgi:hypothetical protein